LRRILRQALAHYQPVFRVAPPADIANKPREPLFAGYFHFSDDTCVAAT
jgi:hypothetical protein